MNAQGELRAAEAWKRLHPDETRGGNQKKAKPQKCGYEAFAKSSFKVGEKYAGQALAILNHSAELLEVAKATECSTGYK